MFKPPKLTAKERMFERDRAGLIGVGLALEEPFYSQALENPRLTKKARTRLLVQTLAMYCRYAESEKAAVVANELMKMPTRFRGESDVVVAKKLVELGEQDEVALAYVDLALKGKSSLQKMIPCRWEVELNLIRATLVARSPESSVEKKREAIQEVMGCFMYQLPIHSILELLRAEEEMVFEDPYVAESVLNYVRALLTMGTGSPSDEQVIDIRLVDAALNKSRELQS